MKWCVVCSVAWEESFAWVDDDGKAGEGLLLGGFYGVLYSVCFSVHHGVLGTCGGTRLRYVPQLGT